MPDPRPVEIPPDELQFTYVRSSGAGGQNVNKVSSKAVLRWNFTASRALAPDVRERFQERYASRLTAGGDLVITSDRHRDQARNAEDCVEKLRAMIATVQAAPVERRATRPTRGSKLRTLKEKKARGETKKGRSTRWE